MQVTGDSPQDFGQEHPKKKLLRGNREPFCEYTCYGNLNPATLYHWKKLAHDLNSKVNKCKQRDAVGFAAR